MAFDGGEATIRINATTSGLKSAASRATRILRGIGRAMRRVSVIGAGVFAGAVAGIGLAVARGAEFQQTMRSVGVISGATADDMARLEKQARELGASTQFSATQAAGAMKNFSLAGLEVNETLKAMQPTLNLAAAGQIDISSAADIAAGTLRGFSLEASRLNEVADVMVATFTNANTTLEGVGDAFKFAAPIANSAGVNFKEVATAVAAMSDNMIRGQMAGRNLRQILLKLLNPTKEGQDVMDEFGISVKDAAGNLLPLPQIIRQFEEALSGMNDASRAAQLGRIFPAEAVGGFAALVNRGSDNLQEFRDRLDETGGIAKRVAEEQMDTLQGAFIRISSAANEVFISITDALGPEIRKVAEELAGLLRRVGVLVKGNADTIRQEFRDITDPIKDFFQNTLPSLVAGDNPFDSLVTKARIAALEMKRPFLVAAEGISRIFMFTESVAHGALLPRVFQLDRQVEALRSGLASQQRAQQARRAALAEEADLDNARQILGNATRAAMERRRQQGGGGVPDLLRRPDFVPTGGAPSLLSRQAPAIGDIAARVLNPILRRLGLNLAGPQQPGGQGSGTPRAAFTSPREFFRSFQEQVFGQKNPQERAAKAGERQVEEQKKINQKLDMANDLLRNQNAGGGGGTPVFAG